MVAVERMDGRTGDACWRRADTFPQGWVPFPEMEHPSFSVGGISPICGEDESLPTSLQME